MCYPKVVGAIDQMEVDEPTDSEKNSGSGGDVKTSNNSDKAKGKRKLYVGSQAIGFRRDNMEVCGLNFYI